MTNQRKAIVIDPADNVATAIRDLAAGERVDVGDGPLTMGRDIPFGHKFALRDIPQGEYAIKYGAPIGRAREPIRAGDHVHVHNLQDITDEVRKNV